MKALNDTSYRSNGTQQFSGGKVENSLLRNYCEATQLFDSVFFKNRKKEKEKIFATEMWENWCLQT
jgi:hypothetical protein